MTARKHVWFEKRCNYHPNQLRLIKWLNRPKSQYFFLCLQIWIVIVLDHIYTFGFCTMHTYKQHRSNKGIYFIIIIILPSLIWYVPCAPVCGSIYIKTTWKWLFEHSIHIYKKHWQNRAFKLLEHFFLCAHEHQFNFIYIDPTLILKFVRKAEVKWVYAFLICTYTYSWAKGKADAYSEYCNVVSTYLPLNKN